MRPVAFIRQMLAAGVDLDTALMAAEKFEDQAEQERQSIMADLLDRLARDAKAEARKEKDRNRKRDANNGIPRNSVESADSVETLSEGAQGSLSPRPPIPPNPPNLSQEPPIVPQSKASKGRRKGDFAKFWAEYPLKVGKGKAEPAYARALRRCESDDPEAEILGGLRRCKPLFEPEFIPHATTWLNRDGWLDQLVPEETGAGATGPPRFDLAKFEAERAALSRRLEAEESVEDAA